MGRCLQRLRLREIVGFGCSGANRVDIHEVCRIDVPASSCPIWVKNKKCSNALYQRRNNLTREVPAAEGGVLRS